jgi:hypothetical protein
VCLLVARGGDGWPARRREFGSDDGTVTGWLAGRLTRGDGLKSAPSWAGRRESGP